MQPAIRVEGLSKRYAIGARERGAGSFRERLAHAATAPWRRYRRLAGETGPHFWALRDVSFEVAPGEVVGVIGANGAGKTTLLRIISRITDPTHGRVELRGRTAALLEVGTGFHPELTGRENVYLNGAILGMRRREIDARFDDIVAFAGVESFLDTPVKRFSSGMSVRLAFAVAAHLEQEILLVDEVLAVGDAEFQRRCLGKIGDVCRAGRTVLFVSHNMPVISRLVTRCLLLEQGRVCRVGDADAVIADYLAGAGGAGGAASPASYQAPARATGNRVRRATVRTSAPGGVHRCGAPASFEFEISLQEPADALYFSFQVTDEARAPVCHFRPRREALGLGQGAGTVVLRCRVPRLRLYQGDYRITTWLSDRRGRRVIERLTDVCPFRVTMEGVDPGEHAWRPGECVYLEDASWERAVPAKAHDAPALRARRQ